jgi:type IV pilus assembly protein PilA
MGVSNLLQRGVHDEDGSRGFTLVELLVVTVILGVLAAIAVQVFLNQRSKGYDALIKSDLRNAASAEEAFLASNDRYSVQSPIGPELSAEGFQYSSGRDYSGGTPTIVVSAVGSQSYCLTARSAGGDLIAYNSANGFGSGGLCP